VISAEWVSFGMTFCSILPKTEATMNQRGFCDD
jgi:hypothetical protein